MAARLNLQPGDIVLHEQPIAVLEAAALHEAFDEDLILQSYARQAQAGGSSHWCDDQRSQVEDASTKVIQRFADLEFEKLTEQRYATKLSNSAP